MPVDELPLPLILLNDEPLFDLTKASSHLKWLPPADASTRMRWTLRGNLDRDGRRVRLESVKVGGRWMTSEAALKRFFAAISAAPGAAPAPTPPRVRQRRVEQAAKRLAARGV
jgi:hypothetical protein